MRSSSDRGSLIAAISLFAWLIVRTIRAISTCTASVSASVTSVASDSLPLLLPGALCLPSAAPNSSRRALIACRISAFDTPDASKSWTAAVSARRSAEKILLELWSGIAEPSRGRCQKCLGYTCKWLMNL